MINSLTLPSLANIYFNSLRVENGEPIYTYTDRFMRSFVLKSNKGDRCNFFNQHYKTDIVMRFSKLFQKYKRVRYICDVLEKYIEFLNKYEKLYIKIFGSKYEDNTDINQNGKTDYNNNKPSMLPILEELSKLDLNNKIQMDFDATSLYPSAMYDEKSDHRKK